MVIAEELELLEIYKLPVALPAVTGAFCPGDRLVREVGFKVRVPELPVELLTVTTKAPQIKVLFWQTVKVALPWVCPYKVKTEPLSTGLTAEELVLLER